ncbi:MAG TPA: helix-turn-helix domain-containing protein [Sphingomicrobium sp.]|nr:helix-turn-helix domain-containing protein [Sphingomicrobium sp.]
MSAVQPTSVREEYKEQTRARILDAAVALIEEAGESPLTMLAVAERAGVTDRTVYRHFETREALVRATWSRMQQLVASQGFPRTAEAMIESPLRLFPRFDAARELVRASLYSTAGRDTRMSSNVERREAMLSSVRDAFPNADEQWLRRRAAIAQLINSAYAWEVLRQYWDIEGEEAGKAAAEALAVLLGKRAADE